MKAGIQIEESLGEIGKHKSLGSAFKVLMLVHRVILEGSQALDSLLLILSNLHYQAKGEL